MSPLEARYRRLLRALPLAYREARAEEMVDTFLLTMQQGDPEDDAVVLLGGRPSFAERLSILGLALRLRWGGSRAPVRYQVQGEAVRWCVSVVVLIQAAVGAVSLLVVLWLAGALPVAPPTQPGPLQGDSIWAALRSAGGMLWIPAFLALIHGRRRTAQAIAILATTPLAVVVLVQTGLLLVGSDPAPGLFSQWVVLGVDAATVLAMIAFHPDAPSPQPRPWLIAGAFTVAAVCAAVLLAPSLYPWVLVDEPGVWCLAAIAASIAVPVAARGWPLARRVQTHLGLAMLCAIALLLRASTVLAIGSSAWPPSAQFGVGIQLVLLAALGAAFTLTGARQLRAMPHVTYVWS